MTETDAIDEHVRTQFLRRVAHDIASPTGVALTVLDELSSGEAPRPELIVMARRSLRRLMRLSEHLALVAELETGSLEPELASTDLQALATQAIDDALAIDGRKDIVASCRLPLARTPITADGRLIVIVLREVIGNALKRASGRIAIAVGVAGGIVTATVEDDGPGFAAESASMLGRRFIARTSARGLGLSLSMAVDILSAHGGTLSIETSRLPPGPRGSPGAAVVLRFPATPARA